MMEIIFMRQPKKYLKKMNSATYKKLIHAIDGLNELQGDIVRLKGSDKYRLKIYHYRIIFTYDSSNNIIIIEAIGSRGDIY